MDRSIEPSDEQLLASISRGESDALGVLYDRYARIAIAVAYRVLGEHGVAEDVVQEAFLAVWRRVDSFDATRGNVRSWLLTIVRNGAIDRRRGRHARALQDTALDDVAFRLATGGEETFEIVASSVEAERVREALSALPPEQREAIELAYFGGLTHQEIAQRTGAPLGTIKGRMRLGLHKLRGSLEDLLPPNESADAGDMPAVEPPKPRKAGPLARLAHRRLRLAMMPAAG
ncbi:MAG: sigma-70 family RNA polymerase sigma factor [Thermomicrobiales bacterium]|nr:sigma-70 family RNA polymerase sigma factor [Thermomicrobiales bacterium]